MVETMLIMIFILLVGIGYLLSEAVSVLKRMLTAQNNMDYSLIDIKYDIDKIQQSVMR